LDDPDTRAAYQRLSLALSPMLRLHSLVISDIMKPPVIRLLDLSNYHGLVGDTIRVVAEDNVAVARLSLGIRDHTSGRAVETFEKRLPIEQLAPTFEWCYTVSTPAPIGYTLEVCVTAFDLAGNKVEAARAL
jgi:hypothetical protein